MAEWVENTNSFVFFSFIVMWVPIGFPHAQTLWIIVIRVSYDFLIP